MQLVTDRRTSVSLVVGVAFIIAAMFVYIAGASAARESRDSLEGVPPTLVLSFCAAAWLWIMGAGLVAYAVGRERPWRAAPIRWSIILLAVAAIGFVGSIVLLYSPSVPVLVVLAVAVVSVALIVVGLVLLAVSLRQRR